jgi:hypothetical protein
MIIKIESIYQVDPKLAGLMVVYLKEGESASALRGENID